MYKAKAWLHSHGHCATAGPGRPPKVSMKDGRDITTILHEAKQSGVQFSDWPKGQITVKKNEETSTDEVTLKRDPVQSSVKTVVELAPYRYTEDEFEAVETVSGKTRSMRESCRGCRVSLVVCYCPNPHIVATNGTGSVEVAIKRKK